MSKRVFSSLLPVLVAVILLGIPDTALAQTLTFSSNPVVMSITGPGATASVSVTLTASGALTGSPYVTTISTSDRTNWLCGQPSGASLTVYIGTGCAGTVSSQLSSNQTYTGQITVNAAGPGDVTYSGTLNVTLQVGNGGNVGLAASPNPVTFSVPVGGTAPSQNVSITSNGAIVPVYSASAATGTGQNWLMALAVASGVSVSVNASGLSAGSYSGTVTATTSAGTLSFPVTLTVGGIPNLNVSPASLSFAYQSGTANPLAQTISLTSGTSPLNVTVSSSTNSGGSQWLVVTPTGLVTTPTQITVNIQPAGLAVGYLYSGTIQIASTGGSSGTVNIPVSLLVSNSPVIASNPGSLTFTVQVGGSAVSQNLTLSSSGAALAYNASGSVTTPGGGTWLVVANQSGTTSGTIGVSVNPAGLPVGTYSGVVSVTAAGAANANLSVPVTLNVTSGPVLQVNVPSLSFAYQTGQAQPLGQTLNITSTIGQVNYSAATQTTTGQAWLNVSLSAGIAPGNLVVSVNTAGLATGTYNGTVTLTPSGASTVPRTIPVTLVVSDKALLLLSPAGATFTAPVGGSSSSSFQNLAITSTDGTAIPYSVATSTSNGANWLLVSSSNGTTPANLSVAPNPAGLSAGTYTGTVTIAATSSNVANSPQMFPVTLNVTSSAALVVSASSLQFAQAAGGVAPAVQTLTVSSTGAGSGSQLAFSAAVMMFQGQNWLTVSPSSGTTPSSLAVNVDGSALSQGTYNGQISLSSGGVVQQSVNVILTVSASGALSVSTNSLAFARATTAGAIPPQTVTVGSTGSSQVAFAAAVTQGQDWLTVTPTSGTTPSTLTVNAGGAGFAVGTYSGQIVLSSGGVTRQTVGVILTVAAGGLLSVSTNSLSFTQVANSSAPPAQTLTVTRGGTSQVAFAATVTTSQGQNWLVVSPPSGTTPATLTVSVNGTGLPAGAYTGQIALSSGGVTQQTVSVALTVTGSAGMGVSTNSLAFTQTVNGSAPAPQTVTVSSNFIAQFSFAATVTLFQGQNWLTVSPSSATTPSTLTVSANGAGLAAGTYTGQIALSSSGITQQVVNVTLTMGAGGLLSVSTNALAFAQAVNGSAPQAQTVSVSSNFIAQLAFSAVPSVNQGGNWLTVSASSATTPSTLTVSANGAGLSAGTYTGQIVLSSGGTSQQTVTVSLVVSSTTQFSGAGAMAHIAAAGNWTTTFTLVNTGTTSGQAQLNFFDDSGTPLALALRFPQTSTSVSAAQATVNLTLTPGSTQIVQATGSTADTTRVGWAQLLTNGDISGFAVFEQTLATSQQEAVVPLETRNLSAYLLPFDNTGNFATGVALANVSSQAGYVGVVIRDDSGAMLQSNTILLPAHGHTSFNLSAQFAATSQRRGTLELQTPSGGQIAVLGLRFNPTAAFSTIPALAK